ncbi:MAG: HgcAB-associated protein HgcC [Spirochaetota bacterium]
MNEYEIEAIATVDARGQIVLPKAVRTALGINPGDKLAVVTKHCGSAPCCITLMPAAALEGRVREVLDAGSSD